MWLSSGTLCDMCVCMCVRGREREEVNTYEQRDKMGDDKLY